MASLRKTPTSTPHIPQVKIDGVEAEPDLAVSATLPDAAHEYQKEITEADEATAVLKRQIEALQQSEQIQRAHAERQHQHTQQMNQLAEFAASEAEQQGHQRGTDSHLSAARAIFHQHLAHLQNQAQAAAAAQQAAANPAPAPEFSRSSLPPLPEPPPERTAHYSAPVSRGEIGGHREPSPSSVRLSVEEKQIAAISGISDLEYARNKLRLAREVQNNERQR